jgi:hypothetical protein
MDLTRIFGAGVTKTTIWDGDYARLDCASAASVSEHPVFTFGIRVTNPSFTLAKKISATTHVPVAPRFA